MLMISDMRLSFFVLRFFYSMMAFSWLTYGQLVCANGALTCGKTLGSVSIDQKFESLFSSLPPITEVPLSEKYLQLLEPWKEHAQSIIHKSSGEPLGDGDNLVIDVEGLRTSSMGIGEYIG